MNTLLTMTGISKSFPGVNALKKVDFDLFQGEAHALVGENGAGKSTLIKILSGVYRADEGEIRLKGRTMVPTGPRDMLNAGISVIYQELNLVPYFSVAENIFLGREPKRKGGLIDWKKMREDVVDLLEPFDLFIDPRAKIHTIGPAYQQVVEIAKALSIKADILVMDEPTASLTGGEVDKLFEIIHNLKRKGVSIVYISHRLEEIHKVADRVTVLRDGELIKTSPLSDISVDEIIRHMVGRKLTEQYATAESPTIEEVLRVEGLSKKGVCTDVSFRVHRGEILGFAGLVGAGRTEIMQLIYGYRKRDSGKIFLRGKELKIRRTREAVKNGIALIPEERKKQGLVLGLSVLDNSALTILDLHNTLGFIKWRSILDLVKNMVNSLGIKTPSLRQEVRNLSGGNQQKVVLSKWFVRNCAVYIFDEPTRGIDVGAKAEIYRLMQALAGGGAAIIMISSELPEVMHVSNRIIVVHEGRIVKEFNRGNATEEEVMSYALGLKADSSRERAERKVNNEV
ncbi:MAG: sugar ABC transporter ATP-binding protein [Spirochaetales bacterium]|nr:MAG: sugar ABC transporter ATP-binding protein [Spirochaetales bacterium]